MASVPMPHAFFGRAVAIEGDTAIVGAREDPGDGVFGGAAYVYAWDGAQWSEQARLLGPSTNVGFGYSVAVDGDSAVVGSSRASGTGSCFYQGSRVDVFERIGTSWSLVQELQAPAVSEAPFIGDSVDICGDTIVVGGAEAICYYGVTWFGEAFVFERRGGGWVLDERLLPEPSPYGHSNFGIDVAIDGDTIVVGAPSDIFSGIDPSAYVFERSGASWARTRLTTPGIGGSAVAVSGETVVAGGLSENAFPASTFIFVKDGAGWEQQQLAPFATNVAVDDDTIALGGVGGSSASTVRLLERVGGRWYQRAPFRPRDTGEQDSFGRHAVALDGTRLLAGCSSANAGPVAGSGAAYVYERDVAVGYCATTINTTGGAAVLRAEGCPSVFEDYMVLHATGVPDTAAIFVYGDSPRQSPFGAGTRCVGGTVFRTRVQRPDAGLVSWRVEYRPPNPSREISAGSTWYFQSWFRDGPSEINTTDGLEITFLP